MFLFWSAVMADNLKVVGIMRNKGFSLVELIIVLGILGILTVMAIAIFNPSTQFNKGKNTKRQHDFTQIKTALDMYYNDHGCYPLSVPFGKKWSQGTTLYMEFVPQDDDCGINKASCYRYEIDGNSPCPQWDVLYASLNIPQSSSLPSQCPLTSLPNCLPTDYASSGVNYCVLSGNADCNFIGHAPLPITVITPSPTPANCSKDYSCTGGPPSRCNLIGTGLGTSCSPDCDSLCH